MLHADNPEISNLFAVEKLTQKRVFDIACAIVRGIKRI